MLLSDNSRLPLMAGQRSESATGRVSFSAQGHFGTWKDTWSDWSSCTKPLRDNELFPTHDQGRGVRRRVHTPKGWRGFSTCHCHVNWTLRKWTRLPIVSNGLLFEKPPTVWICVCMHAPGYVHMHFLLSLKFTAFQQETQLVQSKWKEGDGEGGGEHSVLWTWVVKQQHCDGRRY